MKKAFATLLFISVSVIGATAQPTETKKPAITAEEVLEKNLIAIGGRQALERITSYELKADFEMPGRGVRGALEVYGKAPAKLLTVRTIEKVGVIKQGYDGRAGWSQDPYQGLRALAGEELEVARRGAIFNAELKWRELFEKVELLETEKLKENEAYAVRLMAKDGAAETRYYAGSFLLLRATTVYEGPQGRIPIETRYADYRELDGVKVAFEWTQQTPVGDTVVKVTAIRHNPEINDSRFAKPMAQSER
jgi:hypothetical protein